MSETIAVGVDAGGTTTVAALSRDGCYESTTIGGPANASSRGPEAAAYEIVLAVRAATGGPAPRALFVAAAGAGRSDARAALLEALRAGFPETPHLAVEDDTRVALRAGHPEGPGIVLVAGTGSVAYAESGDERVLVGGAGYLLGDEGSAFAIGLAAIKLTVRAYDGRGSADETTALVARTFDVTDRDTLLAAAYGKPIDVARVASMAPAIVAFASKGNRAATKIVQAAASELGDLARAAAKAAHLFEASPTIVFAGGLLRENSLLSFLLETRIANEIPGAAVVRLRDEPARTALRFAQALL